VLVGYEMVDRANKACSGKLARIISYPISVSAIIVLGKMPPK